MHLDMDAGANRAAGTPDEEACLVASRRFGNATLVREASREMWGWTWIEDLGRDLCHALRRVRRRPGVFAVVVLTLALILAGTALSLLAAALAAGYLPARRATQVDPALALRQDA